MDKTVIAFKERAGCPGGGKGILIGYDHSFTINTNFNTAICYEENTPEETVIDIIPYGSRLGFHNDGIAQTMARMDYKFPQCVCFRKSCKPNSLGAKEKWVEDDVVNTLNCFEFDSDIRTPEIVCIHE